MEATEKKLRELRKANRLTLKQFISFIKSSTTVISVPYKIATGQDYFFEVSKTPKKGESYGVTSRGKKALWEAKTLY